MTVRRPVLAASAATLACALLACGGVVRNGPRPSTGVATAEELAAAYRKAHEAKDVEQLRSIETVLATLPEWGPVPSDVRSAMEALFKLELEDVRIDRAPANAAKYYPLSYMCRKPNGEPRVHTLEGVTSKLILVVRRPDGGRVEVDAALGVYEHTDGRFYLGVDRLVAADAARAAAEGTAPTCRPIPLGTGGEFIARELDYRDWEKASRQLDEIEQRIKAGHPPPN